MSEDFDVDAAMREYVASGAAREGDVLATLFGVRDAVLAVRQELFPSTLARILRAMGLRAPPQFGQAAAFLSTLPPMLASVDPELHSVPSRPFHLKVSLPEYSHLLLAVIESLRDLSVAKASKGHLGKVASDDIENHDRAWQRFMSVHE